MFTITLKCFPVLDSFFLVFDVLTPNFQLNNCRELEKLRRKYKCLILGLLIELENLYIIFMCVWVGQKVKDWGHFWAGK